MKQPFDIENQEENEMRNSFPNLSKVSRENPFMVPKDYFESLPAIIQEKCVKPSSVIRNKIYVKILKPHYIMMVSLALILTGLMVYKPIMQRFSKPAISENEDYTEYYLLNVENIDENQIAEAVSEDNNSVSSDDVINYLSDDDPNNYDLINNK